MQIVVEWALGGSFLMFLIVGKTVECVLHEKARFLWLGSLFCACVSVALPALGRDLLGNFLISSACVVLMICLCFRFKNFKKFLQILVSFYLAAFLYGGVCYALASVVEAGAIVALLGGVLVIFFAVLWTVKTRRKKQNIEKFCCKVQIEMNGKKVSAKGFLDSGNLLVDPEMNLPISLINFKTFEKLCTSVTLADVLEKSEKLASLEKAHYVQILTAGGGDKIFVFQADEMLLDGKKKSSPLLGLSFADFRAVESDLILSGFYAGEGI